MFDTFCSLSELHKHCCVVKTRLGTEKGKHDSSRVTDIVRPTSPSQRGRPASLPCCKARPVEQQTQVALSHLDSRLLVDEEEGHIGHANEGPFFVGPEHDDRSSLRGLSRYVEVGEANAAQVGSQTNEDVPSAV